MAKYVKTKFVFHDYCSDFFAGLSKIASNFPVDVDHLPVADGANYVEVSVFPGRDGALHVAVLPTAQLFAAIAGVARGVSALDGKSVKSVDLSQRT